MEVNNHIQRKEIIKANNGKLDPNKESFFVYDVLPEGDLKLRRYADGKRKFINKLLPTDEFHLYEIVG